MKKMFALFFFLIFFDSFGYIQVIEERPSLGALLGQGIGKGLSKGISKMSKERSQQKAFERELAAQKELLQLMSELKIKEMDCLRQQQIRDSNNQMKPKTHTKIIYKPKALKSQSVSKFEIIRKPSSCNSSITFEDITAVESEKACEYIQNDRLLCINLLLLFTLFLFFFI